MMERFIQFTVKGETYRIPNAWEELSEVSYIELVRDIQLMARGELPLAMVRVNHVCRSMGWNPGKIKDSQALENLAWLAGQVTFPFLIEYPDRDAALQELDAETRKLCKRLPPNRLYGIGISRYLERLDYRYVVDSCFCKQLVPVIEAEDELYAGYKIDTSFNHLTCSLTALQFIQARSLIGCPVEQLPLLAAILYCPEPYSSIRAHALAVSFVKVPETELAAIAFNFQSFVNYLFTRTEFRLLTETTADRPSAISTGPLESLYNLSADGLGDIDKVERMSLMQYLILMRKKLIDTVRSLHAAKMEKINIAKETGLPINIINQIL